MKFQLKNVGKIKDAEFELKPLTVFIGANGSGKTYAASALWGMANYLKNSVLNPTGFFMYEKILSEPFYQELLEKVKQQFSRLEDEVESINIHFSQDVMNTICEKLHNHIQNNTQNILLNTFKFNLFQEASILLHNHNQPIEYDFLIKRGLWENEDILYERNDNEYVKSLTFFAKCNQSLFYISRSTNYYHQREYEVVKSHFNNILFMIFCDICLDKTNFNASEFIYIPAARTGLMFITHDIVQSQFEHNNRFIFNTYNETKNQQQNNDLTAPLNDFIAKIHNASRPKSELNIENQNTENQLFNKIMGGKLVQDEGQYRFDFQPDGLEQAVPLSASSSLVTELAALSALEDNIREGTFIILEEPEAHLHLSAQREMAKLIVRLINEKKCRILLTTHSDTFLQQINNLIMLEKLSHHNENALADFGIQAAEVIAADDVAVYDFQCVGNETHVENLVCGEYGFVAKSMNDVLIALAKETQSIIEQIDDLEAE